MIWFGSGRIGREVTVLQALAQAALPELTTTLLPILESAAFRAAWDKELFFSKVPAFRTVLQNLSAETDPFSGSRGLSASSEAWTF